MSVTTAAREDRGTTRGSAGSAKARVIMTVLAAFLGAATVTGFPGGRRDDHTAVLPDVGGGRAREATTGNGLILLEGQPTRLEILRPSGGRPVLFALRWSSEGLRVEAAVPDVSWRTGHRSWRYGDGLLVNFVLPEDASRDASRRFVTFGFSVEGGEAVGVVVRRNGQSLLHVRPELTPVIRHEPATGLTRYAIDIPWSAVAPFRPLLDRRAGLNLVVVDQDADGSRRVTSLVADPDFDSETSSERRFAPLLFVPDEACGFRFEAAVERRVVTSREVAVNLATCSGARGSMTFTVSIRNEAGVTTARATLNAAIGPGVRRDRMTLKLPRGSDGTHTLEVDAGDSLWQEGFLVVSRTLWNKQERRIRQLAARADGIRGAVSIDTLRFHLETLRREVEAGDPRSDPEALAEGLRTLGLLISRCERDGSLFLASGYLLAAHRSAVGGTLQPFSLWLPEGFDPSRPAPLMLVLHGSGTDEVTTVKAVAEHVPAGMVVAGPRGRDLSGWYTGTSETEVLEVLSLCRKLFPVEVAFIQGFSMGGYGAWRIAFLHPSLVQGAIVVAGTPENLRSSMPEDDMRTQVGAAASTPFLVIHGDADPAVDIAATDRFVATLREAGYDVEYHRVEGGGHGNYDTGPMISDWIERQLSSARRTSAGVRVP